MTLKEMRKYAVIHQYYSTYNSKNDYRNWIGCSRTCKFYKKLIKTL